MPLRVIPAALAALTLAAPAAAAAPKPSTGAWKLVGGGYSGVKSGTFRIVAGTGKHRGSLYVEKLKLRSEATIAGCADTSFELRGRIKLRTFSNAGYTSWGVGRKGTANQVNDTPVTFTTTGAAGTVRGGLTLVWDWARRNDLFMARVTVGTCLMQPTGGLRVKR